MSDPPKLPPRRTAPRAQFRPEFTLYLVYFFVFFMVFALMLALPALLEAQRALPPTLSEQEAMEAMKQAARGAVAGRLLWAVIAALVGIWLFGRELARRSLPREGVDAAIAGVFGGFQGILFDQKTGVMMGGSDPRKDGQAVGY